MKNRTFYINIVLAILLLAISTLFINELLQNKEFEKTYWDFEIHISDNHQIKLINYSIGNSKDYATFRLNEVNQYNNPFLLDSSDASKNYMTSFIDDKKPYPDQLYITYYSFTEKKFYQYKASLLYNEIRNAGNHFVKERSLILTLLPKGEMKLSVKDNEDRNKEIFIQKLQAEPIQGNLQLLKGDEDYLQNINTIEEYADLITKKYSYKISFSSIELEKLELYSFAGKKIEPAFKRYKQNSIPENIYLLRVGCSKSEKYNFYEKEILSAFEELSKNNTSTLELKGKINEQKKEVEFYLTNGSKTIFLKDKYPDI